MSEPARCGRCRHTARSHLLGQIVGCSLGMPDPGCECCLGLVEPLCAWCGDPIEGEPRVFCDVICDEHWELEQPRLRQARLDAARVRR